MTWPPVARSGWGNGSLSAASASRSRNWPSMYAFSLLRQSRSKARRSSTRRSSSSRSCTSEPTAWWYRSCASRCRFSQGRPGGGHRRRAATQALGKLRPQFLILLKEPLQLGLHLVEEGVDLFLVVAGPQPGGSELLVPHIRGHQRHLASSAPRVSPDRKVADHSRNRTQFRENGHDGSRPGPGGMPARRCPAGGEPAGGGGAGS